MNIRKKADKIKLKIALLHAQLDAVQESCPHVNVVKKPWSNAGWDYCTPEYFYKCTCPDCYKVWNEPQ